MMHDREEKEGLSGMANAGAKTLGLDHLFKPKGVLSKIAKSAKRFLFGKEEKSEEQLQLEAQIKQQIASLEH